MRGVLRCVLRDDMVCLWPGCDHDWDVSMKETLIIVALLLLELAIIIGGVNLVHWFMQ